MYLFTILAGGLLLNGYLSLLKEIQGKPFYNYPLFFHQNPEFIKIITSPFTLIFILMAQAVNGYLITNEILDIIFLPFFSYISALFIGLLMGLSPRRIQWSFILNPIVHFIFFSLLLLILTLINILRII